MSIGRHHFLLLLFSAALILAVLPAQASTVSYTDSTAWATATPGSTTIDFAGLAPAGSFKDYGSSSGYVIDGVSFIGQLTPTTNALDVMDQNFGSPYWNWGAPATLQSPQYDLSESPTFIPYIHIILPDNTTSFAALLGTISPNNLSYQVTLSDGEVFTVPTSTRPELSFFGITADNPITYANFTVLDPGVHSGTYGILTNFQFGTAISSGGTGGGGGNPGDTPEACTMILIGGGLVAMRAFRKHLPMLGI